MPPTPRETADAPIGIFDSGFGGLTVARSVIDQLPHESVVYLGDTARQPYGQKPIGEVREYALECLDHLVGQGVKALVIACNSASAAVLRDARERYDVPVVEVILPATREVPRRLQDPKRRSIGLRVPDHRIVHTLLEALGEPLMSVSLIVPGSDIALTDPTEIRDALGDQIDVLIDGGNCGHEPTSIIDLTGDVPVVVREGRGDVSFITAG